jgi:hypothetical protein
MMMQLMDDEPIPEKTKNNHKYPSYIEEFSHAKRKKLVSATYRWQLFLF